MSTKKFTILFIIFCFLVIGMIVYFILDRQSQTVSTKQPEHSSDNMDVTQKRNVVESKYPEFKNFENQESFAGQSVKTGVDGSDHYFAYIVHGSGLPIVKATCFRVDKMLAVFKVGIFPKSADSYVGYKDINPITCGG